MTCFDLRDAWRNKQGQITLNASYGQGDTLKLPCGQCIGCRTDQALSWTVRLVNEKSLHAEACFATLTYRPSDEPEDFGLNKRDWQLFAKRLRNQIGPFRYYMCGEYGTLNLRPHYHAIIFGQAFNADRKLKTHELTSKSKISTNPHPPSIKNQHPQQSYTSEALDSLWGLGDCDLSDVTNASCAYVARYTHKKQSLKNSPETYERTDPITGETWEVLPEFALMSRHPGIGGKWIQKYNEEVLVNDAVQINGRPHRPPKYYEKTLAEVDPERYTRNLDRRREAVLSKDIYTRGRLKAKQNIMERRQAIFNRPL